MSLQRENQLYRLQHETFDILIIGGGATGSGIALDAALRGYKVALVEAEDFGSGTSSRSTKLIHGGVRYLEDGLIHLNFSQLSLVWEALHERQILMEIAPHLTQMIPILVPTYGRWDRLYYGCGLKIYDWMSGSYGLKKSHTISREETLRRLPYLKAEGLTGGVIYYDGQFDDARMNLSLIQTAADYGAAVANYLPAIKINRVKDHFTGKEWDIKASHYINAAGPFVDEVCQLEGGTKSLIRGSSGTHFILDRHFCPKDTGLLLPKTSDGRVLFLLPWKGSTLVGTTDNPCKVSHNPRPTESDIDYLISQVNTILSPPITRKDIKSSWTGIRPLVQKDNSNSTAHLSRDFQITVSPSKLYSIYGGKWTSYRRMATKLLDTMIANGDLEKKGPCMTDRTLLKGNEEREKAVALIAKNGFEKKLAKGYPYIEAEVVYALQHEFACTERDILERRTRLATLDQEAAEKAFKRVTEIILSLY